MLWKSALAMAMASAVPGVAPAATIIVQSPNFDPLGSRFGTVIYAPAGVNATMRMGRNLLDGIDPSTGKPRTFFSYALDVLTPLQAGNFELQAVGHFVSDPVKLSQIKTLIAHADPLANSANKSAAVQMAIWEILYEPGTSGYNVATGEFRVRGGDAGTARTLANHYLNNVQNFIWLPDKTERFAGLAAFSNQTQIIRDAIVPEPATWAMMIAGFGAVGAALRRRRKLALA